MKRILSLFVILFPALLFSQSKDSIIIQKIDSLIMVSTSHTNQRMFDKALEVNAEAEKLAINEIGEESAIYGKCCFYKGRVYHIKGDIPMAEKWYLEGKNIREKALGNEHPDYARSLGNLGVLYKNSGQFEIAEEFLLESTSIVKKAFGNNHSDYAGNVSNLAALYWIMGQYEKAKELYLESIAIYKNVLGKDDINYARSINNLAILYRELGQYNKTEELFIESKNIREKAFGKEHPVYAASAHNLGILYVGMGQDEKAEQLLLESISITEITLGKEHVDYGLFINNLGALYRDQGQYEKAEVLFMESKTIRKKTLGVDHLDYAASLQNLALLYHDMAKYVEAEQLHLQSKEIRKKKLGDEHVDYASCLHNLGSLYFDMNQFEKSEECYLESKAIRKKVLGVGHPHYAESLMNLANLYKEKGQIEMAESNFLELSIINQELISKALLHLSERELNNYLTTFLERKNQLLSFSQFGRRGKLNAACFNNCLFYKGFLLNSANQLKQKALSGPNSTELLYQLKGYKRRLAAIFALPISERDSTEIVKLETGANNLEKDLTRTVAGYGQASRQVKWQEVQAGLNQGEVAIEFVHYRYYGKHGTDSIMYAALIVKPNDSEPGFIPLFEEKSLDSLLSPSSQRKADYVNHLYTLDQRGLEPINAPQKTLYELIWKPLEQELKGTRTIYFAPSGLLHRLNLGAIPVEEGLCLADHYSLVEWGSTRQLVIPPTIESGPKTAVLFGGVHYDTDTTAIDDGKENISKDLVASRGELSFNFTDPVERVGTWNYLQWTEKEVNSIEPLLQKADFKTSVRKGFNATEESFKSIGKSENSPSIIHIATHGYFFPDPKLSKNKNKTTSSEQVFKMSDHPMIRSGIILAGANHAWKMGLAPKSEMEDGILTAYEISQMDLSNTELVVLSACETGLGDIRGSEGVYGLQRAFKIAGAKYLIMSLWQIPDKETAFFMEKFYRHITEGKLSIPKAFETTQKELRENPFVTPYQWAGFVLVE